MLNRLRQRSTFIAQRLVEPLGEIVERQTVFYAYIAQTGATKGGEEGPAAQSLTDVAGQGTDIGSLSAYDAYRHLHALRVEAGEFKLVDP